MFYSRFLAEKVYRLDPNFVTPAHEFEDGVEYIPTRKEILMGHHFVSVAGAAPIVGPAIALIWGWAPAFLWVVIGTIFASGAHDFGSIWVSSRHKGRSMGDLTNSLISHRARVLFLIVIYFLVLMVNAVFLLVIAALLNKYPTAVIPIFIEIPLAVGIGWLFYKYTKWGILLPSIGALAVMYLTIWLAATLGWEVTVPAINDSTIVTWVLIFLVYGFIATLLPVWVLLQPRDYINGHQLYIGLAVVFVAVLVGTVLHGDGLPVMAPALNLTPEGAPLIFPFLFVTIACGAISGFHSIVGSGTTSKQLDKETDARQIGYGGSIGEGLLAVVAIMAASAGFASVEAWQEHYASWGAAGGLGAKVSAFVDGVAYFMNTGLGIGTTLGATFAAVVVLSFSATTLDTGLRLQKYVTAEFGDLLHLPFLKIGPVAAGIAVVSTGVLALYDGAGKGGLLIWPLFGTTNQLLASLALLVISVFLIRLGRSAAPALIPMMFLISVTSIAMLLTLKNFWVAEQWYLFGIGVVILISAVFIVTEAIRVLRGATGGDTASLPSVSGAADDDPKGM
jgi:carbon starvation protein